MKKRIALLLALVLAFGLVACGGSATTETPDVLVSEPVEETPEAPEISSDPVEEIGEWDGDYETATFADVRKYGFGSTKWDGSLPLTTTNEKVTFGMRISSANSDYDKNPQTKWMEETTGIDVDVKTFMGAATDVITQWSMMFNGGEEMPDILYIKDMGNNPRSEYVEAGYLLNVAGYYMTDSYYWTEAFHLANGNDPVRYNMFMNAVYQNGANQRTGQVYGFADVFDDPLDLVHNEVLINVPWLEKLNLKMPTTIDELYEVLVAFRDKDPNGNGKADEVPMMGLTHKLGQGVDNYLVNAFIQFSPSRKCMIENGKAFSYHDQDEYRQALIFINKLVEEKLLSTLAFTGSRSDLTRLLNPDRDKGEPAIVGVCCGWVGGDYYEYSDTIFTYEPVPALADATGRGGYAMFSAPSCNSVYGLTSDCHNPQLCWRLLDWMHSKEGYLVQRWGEEGVDWDYIENTEYKDMAEGNGAFGGTARFVTYNQGFRQDARWFFVCTYSNIPNYEQFIHPTKQDYTNVMFRKAYANAAAQWNSRRPEEELLVFLRTPEEDELFHEFNTEASAVVNRAFKEFCLGIRDPKSDTDWNDYLKELKDLKFERWAEIGQASYDRQKAETEAIRAMLEKNN